ncbi:N-acetylmuramic acid-6-phosphate etherase [Devosia epidermidihirudinis]|uniref:N-acetylmuramic acid 6-phosphate etherase n=1 Tax=Devosia epidermidihirudinis TaxID=1293439 RepID=A0A0F5Q6B8_9HYPH|nr:N-acetylmuramic acid 6-phosphate etherase [Devosia epidermidihirudinis]KKC35554.1 N-acetylmuramic acid-6-phosphate etherase [Devosia epidermidihirudinis]
MNAEITDRRALMGELAQLVSEERNPASMKIDQMSVPDILATMSREDSTVADAVARTIPAITLAVEATVRAFNAGGRLVYMGAGTSGRLGVLDASECPPTFGVPASMVVGLIAGGPPALLRAIEGAEDSAELGAEDLKAIKLSANDVLVGIAVSGRTPYVIGGLEYANSIGAVTVALSCNPTSTIAEIANIAISPLVGPEVLTGSTRLKSGTAQKLVLNMLTTASMIRIGKTYQNLMIDLHASNEKLLARAVRIVMQATDCTAQEAEHALELTSNDVKLAILVHLTGLDVEAARNALQSAGGFLRHAIDGSAP